MGHEWLEVARLAKQCEPEAGHSGDGTGGVEYLSVKGSRRSCAIQSVVAAWPNGRSGRFPRFLSLGRREHEDHVFL
jgi:hypothetical protein